MPALHFQLSTAPYFQTTATLIHGNFRCRKLLLIRVAPTDLLPFNQGSICRLFGINYEKLIIGPNNL